MHRTVGGGRLADEGAAAAVPSGVQLRVSIHRLPSLTHTPPPFRTQQDGYRNQGGFHMIGSGRDAIAKPDQLAAAAKVRRAALPTLCARLLWFGHACLSCMLCVASWQRPCAACTGTDAGTDAPRPATTAGGNGDTAGLAEQRMPPVRAAAACKGVRATRGVVPTATTASTPQTCMEHDLDGLVVIGGDDSNTNSATMAGACVRLLWCE